MIWLFQARLSKLLVTAFRSLGGTSISLARERLERQDLVLMGVLRMIGLRFWLTCLGSRLSVIFSAMACCVEGRPTGFSE